MKKRKLNQIKNVKFKYLKLVLTIIGCYLFSIAILAFSALVAPQKFYLYNTQTSINMLKNLLNGNFIVNIEVMEDIDLEDKDVRSFAFLDSFPGTINIEGNNFSIKNFTLKPNKNYVSYGLFGGTTKVVYKKDKSIKNLNIKNGHMIIDGLKMDSAGLLLGFTDANLENVTVEGSITLQNGAYVGTLGGAVGCAYGNLKNVISNVDIVVKDNINLYTSDLETNLWSSVGGIVGHAKGNVEGLRYDGNILLDKAFVNGVGGAVGSLNGSGNDIFSKGSIKIKDSAVLGVGGNISRFEGSIVTNLYSSMDIEYIMPTFEEISKRHSYFAISGNLGNLQGLAKNLVNVGNISYNIKDNQTFKNLFNVNISGNIGSMQLRSSVEFAFNYGNLSGEGIFNLGGCVANISGENTLSNMINYGSLSNLQFHSPNQVGGVAANLWGVSLIKNSINYGNINIGIAEYAKNYQNNAFVGGVVGTGIGNKIYNNINYGNLELHGITNQIVGGIVGQNDGEMESNLNVGNISASSTFDSAYVGGIVGITVASSNFSIINNIAMGTIEGDMRKTSEGGFMDAHELLGGILGYNRYEKGHIMYNSYDAETISKFTPKEGFTKPLFWYGEEEEADNVNGPNMIYNQALTRGEIIANSNKHKEFVSLKDLDRNPRNVWIFDKINLPTMYYVSDLLNFANVLKDEMAQKFSA